MAEATSSENGVASQAGASEPRPPNLPARLRALASQLDFAELSVVLAILALCVAVRLLRLQPIEYYDDEVTRWHFVRQWFHSNEFGQAQWTHHMARFGLNVPLYFVQALFGRHASTYYIWPVASFALQVLLLYLTTKRLGGRAAAVLAAIFLSVFTGMNRGASQILPDAFSGTALILMCYLLTYYHDAVFARRVPWLIGASLAFIWAYQIKESNLLFFPGAAVCVWLCRGRFRDGVLFGAVVIGAIALETAGFRIWTNHGSRFGIVGEAHGDITSSSFLSLFDRFTRLEPSWQMLFWMWVPAALWLAGKRDRRLLVLVLLPATFLLLLTFMVRSVNPIVIWTRFYSRYFEPTAPFFVGAIALFAVAGAGRVWQAHAGARLQQLPARLSRGATLIAVMTCLLVGLAEYAAAKGSLPDHALREVRRYSSITNDAYRRNLPIVHARARSREPEERRVRALKAVYGIYLDDAQIATSSLTKNGWLPNVLDAVRHTKRYAYVLHDPGAYSDAEIEEWIERGCAVVLTEAKGHPGAAAGVPSIVVTQSAKLPAECRPPQR